MTKYYEVLDLAPEATPEQIKAAYRILVQLHHPDRLQQAQPQVRQYAEDRLKRINEAYAVLSDPARRAQYDATLRQQRAAQAEEHPEEPAWPRPRTARQAAYAEARAWAAQAREAERAAQTEARQRRAQQAAEAERRAAEQRLRQQAQTQYPRVQRDEQRLRLHLAPALTVALLRIPAGEFWMGADPASDPEAAANEQPRQRIYLSEYYLSQHPVTQAQFQVFVRAAPAHLSPALAGWQITPGQENFPAVNLTWDDAVAFCRWLSAATGRGFRLPTEAEWEKAARGPTSADQAYSVYPWGNTWDPTRLAVAGQLAPVGQHSPAGDSGYGLCDMSGNVWEWCADWYDAKLYARRLRAQLKDPLGPETGQGCVARGGAYDSTAKQCRCARRNWFYPQDARPNVGFRITAAL